MSRLGWIIGAVFVAGVGVFAWQTTQPAPEPTGHSMVTPDTSDLALGDPIADVIVPESLSADAQLGQRIFETTCATCHGINAAGQNGVAPPLIHTFYRPGHHSDEAFQMAAANGVRSHHWNFGNMPRIEGVTRADVQYIARYIREVQQANGIE